MNHLKIALIQMNIIWESKQLNYAHLENNYFSKIKQNDIDLILLPEMFATGFTMKPKLFWEDENGSTFKWLKKWAINLNCSIGAGIITKNNNGEFLNTFIICHPNQANEFYHKRHLFRMGDENIHYKAGFDKKILDFKGWKINLQICYDLRFPVFARNKLVNDIPLYDAMIYIANWPKARQHIWLNLLQARAIENQCYILGVNRVGLDYNQIEYSGGTSIFDPNGAIMINPINSENLFIYSIYKDVLEKSRQVFPVLRDGDDYEISVN